MDSGLWSLLQSHTNISMEINEIAFNNVIILDGALMLKGESLKAKDCHKRNVFS